MAEKEGFRVYNSMTQQKEIFNTHVPGRVGMYVCGVTAYDLSHIGHARAAVNFDVLYRYLQHLGYEVTYVRNFTDVDDKELCFVDMSSSSGNFSGSCGHMCNEQTCVLRTSLSLYNFGRRFLGCSHYKIGPKCPFFVWLDNPTYPHGNETTPLALERMSRLQSALQLTNERERTALETTEEARKMEKKALEEEAKAKERERDSSCLCKS